MPLHILVLDDQPDFYKYLFYNNAGVEKRLCTTKQAFLGALQEGTAFDLILLDLSLEGEKASGIGLDFLLELKKTWPVLPPVLVVTNDNRLHTYRAAMNRGAIGFYNKGKYSAEDLDKTIYQVLERYQLGDIPNAPTLPEFVEWFRSTRDKPSLIYGPDGIGKDFWIRQCLRTYFPTDSINIVDFEPKDAEINWQDATAPLEEFVSETIEPINALSSSQTHWIIKGVNYIDIAQVQQINKFLSRVPNPIFVSTTDLQELVHPAHVISSVWRTALLGNAFDMAASQPVLTEILGYWLSFTKVCPMNSPFYGAKVAEVFDSGVFEKLTQKFGSVYHRKLFEATQSMLYRAQERMSTDGHKMVIPDDLPNELKLNYTPKVYTAAPSYTESFLSAEKYLAGIENCLSSEMTDMERTTLDKNRPRVEGYYRNYHSRLDKQGLERTIRYFVLEEIDLTPFRIFVAFHSESEVFYDRFEKHIAQLKREFCIEINHFHNADPGTDVRLHISEKIRGSDLILVFCCPYLIAHDEFYEFIEYGIGLQKNHYLVLINPCDWRLTRLQRFAYFPADERYIGECGNLHRDWNELVEEIRFGKTNSVFASKNTYNRMIPKNFVKRKSTRL